jgi:hypothetical protein
MGVNSGQKPRFLRWAALGIPIAIAFVVYRFVFAAPSYDAVKIAEAETKMWQAYYSGDQIQLGFHLVGLLRSQYGLSLLEAKAIGEALARAAIAFLSAKGNYEQVALPDLIQAYSLIQSETGASFDPEEVAKAELAWWIARRTPGEDSPEQVGEKIARQYILLYGLDEPSFHEAGLLRARAARLRDLGGATADWAQVENLLIESYTVLAEAL